MSARLGTEPLSASDSRRLTGECDGVRHFFLLANNFQLHLGATYHFTKIDLHLYLSD